MDLWTEHPLVLPPPPPGASVDDCFLPIVLLVVGVVLGAIRFGAVYL